ncbi:hypothetical protein [uncultured Sphingomonas sp.]|nr:hypothetical protein [uncultured Sphingomonas sp.]
MIAPPSEGRIFGHEHNRLAIRDEVYTLAELREETARRWRLRTHVVAGG